MLLSECGLLHLAIEWLEDRLKVCIDDERRLSTIRVLVEFDLGLFGAWRLEYIEQRHEDVSSEKLLVTRKYFFQ